MFHQLCGIAVCIFSSLAFNHMTALVQRLRKTNNKQNYCQIQFLIRASWVKVKEKSSDSYFNCYFFSHVINPRYFCKFHVSIHLFWHFSPMPFLLTILDSLPFPLKRKVVSPKRFVPWYNVEMQSLKEKCRTLERK